MINKFAYKLTTLAMVTLMTGCTVADATGSEYTIRKAQPTSAPQIEHRLCLQRVFVTCTTSIATAFGAEHDAPMAVDYCAGILAEMNERNICGAQQ